MKRERGRDASQPPYDSHCSGIDAMPDVTYDLWEIEIERWRREQGMRKGVMRKGMKAKLEAAGWVVGSVKEFLGLSEADTVLIEVKLALSRSLRERRNKQGLSQVQLAERLQSSQSRVAKMEAGDPSVSMDLLVSSLLLLGASSADLANAIKGGEKKAGSRAA
jgi:DNA-binding XRE family transcriptional regulator